MTDFVMPILGADMTAGTLVAWRKQAGDRVQHGDIVAEVETEKGLIEVEIFSNGVIEKILVAPGTTVPVGTVLAVIREDGDQDMLREPANEPSIAGEGSPPYQGGVRGGPGIARQQPPPGPLLGKEGVHSPTDSTPRRISPAARKRAAELGVDLATVRGTGPDGAITRADIERAGTAPAAAAAPDLQARLRQTIAAAMTRSKREIPHYYLSTTIDLHRAMTWLGEQNRARPVTERLLPGVLLLKATALALREVPELNGVWAGDHAQPADAIHVGVAVALRGGGLVAPALHHTDRQRLDELMRNLRDLVNRVRAGSLRSSELADPTITVTNIGEQGVDGIFGIIYPPQVAIVGFGKIAERPWVAAGQLVARPLVTAALSADHRVTDGHRGARFLAAVDRLLQEPEAL